MAILKCKMCGGDLNLIEGASTAVCDYCGSNQTVPKADDEKKLALFARANRLRTACDFDKAAGIYEGIVADFPEEAEAYWSLVLCRYGIEYVDDPATGRKLPTCHCPSFDSIMEDGDFEQALENADIFARRVYREEAKQIEEIRKGIIAVSNNEKPYDIFICYKETAENGDRTLDSVLAQDVYDALTDKGYRVFFSRISLEDKLGTEYEPYIFAALNSAKIMLVFGTDYEYFNAVWVKNEWSRFLKLMTKDKDKHLIPCFKGIDAYDMPKEFARLQAQDLSKVGATQDLLRGIEKILPRKVQFVEKETIVIREMVSAGTSAENEDGIRAKNLLMRGQLALKNRNWEEAVKHFDEALNLNAECIEAYIGKCCAFYRDTDIHQIIQSMGAKILANTDLKNALRFMDPDDAAKLQEEIDAVDRQFREEKRQKEEAESRKKAEMLEPMRLEIRKAEGLIGAGWGHTVALNLDGTVTAIGRNDSGQCNVSGWEDCVAVWAWHEITVALKADGTVLATGNNKFGQCNVDHWTDCVAVAPGTCHTVGLRKDGTVLAAGRNTEGQCDVSEWTDCVAVAAGGFHTVGLKADGSVIATGENEFGQCNIFSMQHRNCVAIAAGYSHTVALMADGTVVATGDNKEGQCNVDRWRDCYGIAAGEHSTVALQRCASPIISSRNNAWGSNTEALSGSVAIAVGYDHMIGLKRDGKLLVRRESNHYHECDVHNWKLFKNLETIEEERTHTKNSRQWRIAGCCQHCGGELKGFFSKKCTFCGKPKDY